VIRTQELLAARRVDGGTQFFSRANDFGYSKHPDETFNIWDRDQVLSDFVWVYRTFRPDIIVTRFNKTPGGNHGHHTASAILAHEAFKLSGDSTAFPEQLDWVDPWSPSKLYWNTGWWWFRSGYDTASLSKIDVGTYNTLLGKSYTEIAAQSRSMHKSQGFGSSGSRGQSIEYLQQWDGVETDGLLDGIETTWNRVEGSEEVMQFIEKAINEFDETNPAGIVEPLVLARRALQNVDDEFWKEVKTREIDELIKAVCGLFIEFTADRPYYAPGDSMQIELEAINRSSLPITLESIQFKNELNPIEFNTDLINNRIFVTSLDFILPSSFPYSNPYWLNDQATLGMYSVEDQLQRGKPENDPSLLVDVSLSFREEEIVYQIPVVFKRTDRVEGEG
jgi:hypothetical protein